MAEPDPWAEFLGAPAPATAPHDPWAEFVAAPRHEETAAVLPDVAKSVAYGAARNAPIAALTAPTSLWDLGARAVGGMVNLAAPDSLLDLSLKSARDFAERNPAALRDLADRVETPEFKAAHSYADDPAIAENFRRQASELEKRPEVGRALSHGMNRFQDVSERVTKAGIPDYEPQTKTGEYAKTIAEFVPQAVATGGGSAVANAIKGGVAPAIGSQAAGDYTKGTWLETPARIAGAIFGGGAAHAGEAGVNAARTAGAARSAAGEAGRLVGDANVTPGAVTRMAKDIRNDQLTPEAAETRMTELGPEGMMLDAGRQLQGRAEAIATQPGIGQNRVLNAVENRTGRFGEGTAGRVRGTLNAEMGESPDVVKTADTISKIVDEHAGPLYNSVMEAHPVVEVPASIASRPAVAAAMRDAPEVARNYGEQLQQPTTRTVLNAGGVPVQETIQEAAQPSLRYWDYVKKVLDKRINGYYKSGPDLASADKADLGGLQAARTALVNHLDEVTGGAYASARQVAANKPQLKEALQEGREALNTKLLPEELRDIHDNMSIPQQAMLRTGMRREIERIMAVARNDGAAARRILDTDQNREKIATLFGQPAAEAIDKRIAAETQFQEATNKISASSRTGVRQQLVKDTESPSAAMPPMANLTGFATKGLGSAVQAMRDTGMERTRAALGSLATAPASQVPELVRILAGYNTRAAANAPPPTAPAAKNLASTLVVNELMRLGKEQERRRAAGTLGQ